MFAKPDTYSSKYSQRHSVINHCGRHITHLNDLNISFVLLNISSKFLLHLVILTITQKAYQNKSYISITKKNDMPITVIYHAISLTVP